jgi:DNA-binding GntR family transcriptional regulator
MTIRDWILRNQLPLGAPISRRQLSARLNMSLLPVAEALQRLEADGLIESKPRAGTRVKVPTREDIWERYTLREALECQAARLFAERATPQERLELGRMAEQLDALFNSVGDGKGNPELQFAVHGYHLSFHMRLAEYTRCGALREAIEKNHVLVFNWLFDISGRERPLPPRFHEQLIRVVGGNDADAAEKAMREHIRYGLEEITRAIEPRALLEWRAPRSPQKVSDNQ